MSRRHLGQHLEEIFGRDMRAAADAGAVPKLSGLSRFAARKDERLSPGFAGFVLSDSGLDATTAIGLKSAAAKPLFLYSVSLIASAVVVTSRCNRPDSRL